ncbi:hypothetical protein GQ602_005015 [Ophiocordyceps camponoti-floridani]|uniref:Uncharacterized protein n=1 Tax=Ophiocordyceps camponoti-floridani TaxID=2030778 RepID=A0A8H4Q4W4_9HYPO|nr:hypothetical protein GQ602_005015 [Ophiocordyceps camponoti-floridani]
MAIRDRIRRVLHKSHSSGSDSSSHTDVNDPTATPALTTTVDAEKQSSPPSPFARVFHNFRSDEDRRGRGEPRIPKGRRKGRKPIHPSLRPLTVQNLQHQEMLSHFTMTFGASDPDQIESLNARGISPCCTRTPSVDGDFADLHVTDTPTDTELDHEETVWHTCSSSTGT